MFSITNPEKTTAPVDKGSPSNLPLDPAPLRHPAHRPVTVDPSTSRDLSSGLVPDMQLGVRAIMKFPYLFTPTTTCSLMSIARQKIGCSSNHHSDFWINSRTGFYSSIPCDWRRFNRLCCRKSSWLPTQLPYKL